jgi:hypothetical protein
MVAKDGRGQRVAIVACDALMITRPYLDEAAAEIERRTGIATGNVLINCTHTHSAPSTCTVHGYERDEKFCRELVRAVVEAVVKADVKCGAGEPVEMRVGVSPVHVGQNSRLRLSDGAIHWIGKPDDVVGPTGPFDPDLTVIGFRRGDGGLSGLMFNHSTHTIGAVTGNVRSPAFYGMAAQAIERELGGVTMFIEGASGSTHNLAHKPAEAEQIVEAAVRATWASAAGVPVERVGSIKREVTVTVRRFDEAAEDQKVSDYCRKRAPASAESTIKVFRDMRAKLAGQQGQTRKTWVQVVRIGDVAIVGVPAEFFTKLGVDIKRQSPFKHTIIAELANDWVGYVGDAEAYELGGYQMWMGMHSWTARGTGEMFVDEAVKLLKELHGGAR